MRKRGKPICNCWETYYDDDSNHAFYASFLENVEEYTEAYREREIAAMLDLNDANRFTSLGVHMLNYKNVAYQ